MLLGGKTKSRLFPRGQRKNQKQKTALSPASCRLGRVAALIVGGAFYFSAVFSGVEAVLIFMNCIWSHRKVTTLAGRASSKGN